MTTRKKFAYWSLFWWAFLMLLCFGTPTPAANNETCTAADADYLWTELTDGSCVEVDATDTCVIAAGREILCPAGTTCTCGRLDLDGSLVVAEGATLVIGDSANDQATAADIDGTLTLNGTLHVNCAADGQASCEIVGNSGGQMLVRGRKVADGTVRAVVKEACPQGYLDPAIDTGNDGAEDCDTSTEYDVTILVSFPVAADQYNGMRLYFPPPFSGHQGTHYDIRDSVPPNKLVLNGASRGQLLPHGAVLTLASVAGMNGTTATITAISAANQLTVVGGWLTCDADCPASGAINESASPAGLPSHTINLPCGDATRIIAAPNTTTLTLQAAGTGAACGAGAGAGRITIEPGASWPRVDIAEAVRVGDVFEIAKPAVVSIPQANKGISLTYATAGVTSQDKNFVMDVGDNFVLDAEYFDWGYCGRKDDAISDECIEPARTVANTTGYSRFRHGEFYFTSGGNFLTEFENEDDPVLEWVTHRDSSYSDNNDQGDQHGFLIGVNTAFPGADISIKGLVCRRINDDCIYDGPDLMGDDAWRNISILDSGTVWMPNNTPGGATAEHIQFGSENRGITGALRIRRNFALDAESGIKIVINGGNVDLRDTVIVNSQKGFGASNDLSSGATLASRPTFLGNIACLRCGETTTPLSIGGKVSAAYIDHGGVTGASTTDWATLASLYGVVLEGTNAAGSYEQYDPGTTTAAKFETGGPVLRDVVWITGTAFVDGITQRAGLTNTVRHNTWIQVAGDNSTGDLTETLTGGGGEINIKDSIVYGVVRVVDSANGLPTTYDVNNNLVLGISSTVCSGGNCGSGTTCGATCGAANVLTGDLGVLSSRNPLVLPGSAARSVTTSDGSTYVGARCSGPTNWALLESLSPAVSVAGRPGVVDPALCADEDGDGWWDLHDTCDTDPDPLGASCE